MAASGVVVEAPSPTKIEIELLPVLAVQILPLASTAIPAGEFSEPSPVLGVTAFDPENSEMELVFANQTLLLAS